jgi:hypothetical protein
MTTKRRTIRRGGRGRITPEVIAAWGAGDYGALHLALHLHPWCHSPLPKEIICLGVDQNSPPHFLDVQQREDWRQAAALQAELLKIAGWPDCRQAYRKNLADALKWQRYCKELVQFPERGGQGTGCDPASRRRDLEKAETEVAYRRRLLEELDEAA